MRRILGHRLMLVGIYLVIGIVMSALGRAQVRAKLMQVVEGKITFSREATSSSPKMQFLVVKTIQ
ncbi:hypothetical protein ACFQ4C_01945 [Larkinella insperata]|uniref:Uncharacterized protein n=1 Tax=Larkinella insperata TaxID=332158 RepID=A0ABW3Q5Y8_9BACT|nr:hypothetical protein [Larkinella insperata]